MPDGELGSICITELYKTGSPQFRYNIMDLSYLYPREQCACGSWLRRMGPFAGRGDNMVKLRGVNVWPEAVGPTITTRVACAVVGGSVTARTGASTAPHLALELGPGEESDDGAPVRTMAGEIGLIEGVKECFRFGRGERIPRAHRAGAWGRPTAVSRARAYPSRPVVAIRITQGGNVPVR